MSTLWLRPTARLARPYPTRSFFTSRRVRLAEGPLPTSSSTPSTPAASIPSFRDQLSRVAEPVSFAEQVSRPRIRNQIIFTVFGSWLAYTVAAILTNEDTEEWSSRLIEANPFSPYSPLSSDMRKARYLELGKDLQSSLNSLKEKVKDLPKTIQLGVTYTYAKGAQYYLDNTENRRTCWALGGVCTAVWVAWKVRRWNSAMMRRFTHDPLSGRATTLLTSVFSHNSIFHLGFNCMALASFGSSTMVWMAKEQEKNPYGMPESTVGYHFMAFFVAAGLFSGLTSHVVSAKFKFPRLLARLSKPAVAFAETPKTSLFSRIAAPTREAAADAPATIDRSMKILPSLGASGAIYASVTLTALAFPDAVVSLIFPPTYPIAIQTGVGGLVLLDVVGALRGWSLFDHWAHLGGAAFGVLYYYYGPAFWDFMRSLDAEMVDTTEDNGTTGGELETWSGPEEKPRV